MAKKERESEALILLKEFLYDLTKLYYLATLKMEFKKEITLDEEDEMLLKKAKDRIDQIDSFLHEK